MDIADGAINLWPEDWVPVPGFSLTANNNHVTEEYVT